MLVAFKSLTCGLHTKHVVVSFVQIDSGFCAVTVSLTIFVRIRFSSVFDSVYVKEICVESTQLILTFVSVGNPIYHVFQPNCLL